MFRFAMAQIEKEEWMSRTANVEDTAVTGSQPLSHAERQDLGKMTKPELLDFAETRGVIVDAAWPKAQIVHVIEVAMEVANGFSGVPNAEEESVPTVTHVIASLVALVDQRRQLPPPAATEWSCLATSDQVLRFMIQKGLPVDLFRDGATLAAFLRVPGNAKQVKASGIHIGFPPWQGKELIRVERCDPGQYMRTDI